MAPGRKKVGLSKRRCLKPLDVILSPSHLLHSPQTPSADDSIDSGPSKPVKLKRLSSNDPIKWFKNDEDMAIEQGRRQTNGPKRRPRTTAGRNRLDSVTAISPRRPRRNAAKGGPVTECAISHATTTTVPQVAQRKRRQTKKVTIQDGNNDDDGQQPLADAGSHVDVDQEDGGSRPAPATEHQNETDQSSSGNVIDRIENASQASEAPRCAQTFTQLRPSTNSVVSGLLGGAASPMSTIHSPVPSYQGDPPLTSFFRVTRDASESSKSSKDSQQSDGSHPSSQSSNASQDSSASQPSQYYKLFKNFIYAKDVSLKREITTQGTVLAPDTPEDEYNMTNRIRREKRKKEVGKEKRRLKRLGK